MDVVYVMTPAVRAQLAMLGLQGIKEEQVRQMLEAEFWRGYMQGETDTEKRVR